MQLIAWPENLITIHGDGALKYVQIQVLPKPVLTQQFLVAYALVQLPIVQLWRATFTTHLRNF